MEGVKVQLYVFLTSALYRS